MKKLGLIMVAFVISAMVQAEDSTTPFTKGNIAIHAGQNVNGEINSHGAVPGLPKPPPGVLTKPDDWMQACPKLVKNFLGAQETIVPTPNTSVKLTQATTMLYALLDKRDLMLVKFPGVSDSTKRQKSYSDELGKLYLESRQKPENIKLRDQIEKLHEKMEKEEEVMAKLKRNFGKKNATLISELRTLSETTQAHDNFENAVKGQPVTLVKSYKTKTNKTADIYFSGNRLIGYRLQTENKKDMIRMVNADCSASSTTMVDKTYPYDYFTAFDNYDDVQPAADTEI